MSNTGRIVVFIAGLLFAFAGSGITYILVGTGAFSGPKSLEGFMVMLVGTAPGGFMMLAGILYMIRAIKNPSTG